MERQSKEESIVMFRLECEEEVSQKWSNLLKTIKPLILDYTITYEEFKSDIADMLVEANERDNKESTNVEQVDILLDGLIEKYKKIRYEKQKANVEEGAEAAVGGLTENESER